MISLYERTRHVARPWLQAILNGSCAIDLSGIPLDTLMHGVAQMSEHGYERVVPSVMPPFFDTWVEYDNGGLSVFRIDLDGRMIEDAFQGAIEQLADESFHGHTHYFLGPDSSRPTSPVSLWCGALYIARDHKSFPTLEGYVSFLLDDEGQVPTVRQRMHNAPVPHDSRAITFAAQTREDDTVEDSHFRRLSVLLDCFFFGIGLLHCKNVELVDAPMPPDKVRRKREKKLGHPLTQMKTLVLRPLATQKRREGDGEKHIPTHTIPLHICRGHFATYSEDRPLFGKYAGTFWIPAHVRGTEDAGKVFKDYAIKAGGA